MENEKTTPFSVLVYRLIWTFLGPAVLCLTAVSIATSGGGWLTGKDLLFGVLLVGTILCRWGDFAKGDRRNTYGEPVNEKDLRLYTIYALVAGVLLWGAVNVVGNHLL